MRRVYWVTFIVPGSGLMTYREAVASSWRQALKLFMREPVPAGSEIAESGCHKL